ncbi:hypothetical protein AB0N20_31645 [Streptomyces griseoincarnatus]
MAGVPRDPREKLDDAAKVHEFTRLAALGTSCPDHFGGLAVLRLDRLRALVDVYPGVERRQGRHGDVVEEPS